MAKRINKWHKKYNQFQLTFDLKTIVILTFTFVWALVTVFDLFNEHYDVPQSLNMILGGVIAYFTASKLKEGE